MITSDRYCFSIYFKLDIICDWENKTMIDIIHDDWQ